MISEKDKIRLHNACRDVSSLRNNIITCNALDGHIMIMILNAIDIILYAFEFVKDKENIEKKEVIK